MMSRRKNGYWHGILLVPNDAKLEILELLNQIRINCNFDWSISRAERKKTIDL